MALLDIFKKKKPEKEVKKEKKEKPKAQKKEPAPAAPPLVKKKAKPAARKERKVAGFAYRVLRTPHVSEKATELVAKNQYVFKVYPRANKIEVKKAVEDVYGVDVVSVRIVNVPRKRRRLGRTEGFRKGYKKAIVKLGEDQKIEVLPR